MIVFPKSTLVGKPVPKTAFYRNLEVNAKMKQRFVDSVESITWTAKLAPSTLSVADGKTVHEIAVFRIELKGEVVPTDVLALSTARCLATRSSCFSTMTTSVCW